VRCSANSSASPAGISECYTPAREIEVKATAIEFRLRMMIQIVIVSLALWAPWVRPWDIKLRMSALEWLALEIGRTGLVTFAAAVPIVIVFAALLAAAGAWLRVWGAAYLGYDVVHHAHMQGGGVMTAGPYRYMRNPLYLGGWFMMVAISLLLTPSGALLLVVLTGFFYLRLILGEETFLAAKLGEPYREYLCAVPRIVPRLRVGVPAAASQAHWLVAILTEVMPIGAFITMAVVPWSYDNIASLRGILISFVVSMVVRGLLKAAIPTVVFLAIAGAAWGLMHLSFERAMLIGFGAALVVWAVMPRRANSDSSPEPSSDLQ
jgi:protein-S-isoprenylcysteine O-methyltransferase Ste14